MSQVDAERQRCECCGEGFYSWRDRSLQRQEKEAHGHDHDGGTEILIEIEGPAVVESSGRDQEGGQSGDEPGGEADGQRGGAGAVVQQPRAIPAGQVIGQIGHEHGEGAGGEEVEQIGADSQAGHDDYQLP